MATQYLVVHGRWLHVRKTTLTAYIASHSDHNFRLSWNYYVSLFWSADINADVLMTLAVEYTKVGIGHDQVG